MYIPHYCLSRINFSDSGILDVFKKKIFTIARIPWYCYPLHISSSRYRSIVWSSRSFNDHFQRCTPEISEKIDDEQRIEKMKKEETRHKNFRSQISLDSDKKIIRNFRHFSLVNALEIKQYECIVFLLSGSHATAPSNTFTISGFIESYPTPLIPAYFTLLYKKNSVSLEISFNFSLHCNPIYS